MKRAGQVITVVAIAVLALPRGAAAHRLDEYLQATRLAIGPDSITLEISLTPGAGVADRLLPVIDADRDGRISENEAAAYARRVAGDLRLDVDDRAIQMRLSQWEFPGADEMRAGVGVIRLAVTADHGRNTSGQHRISYANAHMPEVSAFLVNTLVPESPAIRIGG